MKINNEELIEKFARKLVEDKGAISDEEEKKREVERIIEEVDDLFIEEIVGSLPEERKLALDKIAEETGEIPEEKLNTIIFGAKLDFPKIVEKVVFEYRKKYLGEEK